MPRILDTIPDFEAFARRAGLESPTVREGLWSEVYEAAHPEVFKAFYDGPGSPEGMHAIVRELSKVRLRVKDSAPEMPGLIETVEPAVAKELGVGEGQASPLHVLMVGTFSTNGFVGKLKDDVAVFHCMEWFSGTGPTSVLIAHEDTHAWHQLVMGKPKDLPTDLGWTAFYEGLAIQASRLVVPDRPEDDYFWYGVAGFEEWLVECRKEEANLLKEFKRSLDKKDATEAFFGSGFVETRWRVGYYIADLLVGRIGRPLSDLLKMSVEEGREAIKGALEA